MNQVERPVKPRRIQTWPLIVVGLLLLNVGVCAVTIVAATRHPAIVEPNYYDKGLRWDEIREIRAAAQKAKLVPAFTQTLGVISLSVLDTSGQAMQIEGLLAVAVHESMPGVEVPLAMKQDTQGSFISSFPLRKPGLWRVAAAVSLDPALDPFPFTAELTISP